MRMCVGGLNSLLELKVEKRKSKSKIGGRGGCIKWKRELEVICWGEE